MRFQRDTKQDRSYAMSVLGEYRKKLARALHSGEEVLIALAKGRLADILRVLGQCKEAIALVRDSIESLQKLQKTEDLPVMKLRYAIALQYDDQHEQAMCLMNELIASHHNDKPLHLVDFVYQHSGKCLVEMGLYEEAMQRFRKAESLRVNLEDSSRLESTKKAMEALRELMRKS